MAVSEGSGSSLPWFAEGAGLKELIGACFAPKERVAQLVEHLTFNQEVMGSNPIALTNETNEL